MIYDYINPGRFNAFPNTQFKYLIFVNANGGPDQILLSWHCRATC